MLQLRDQESCSFPLRDPTGQQKALAYYPGSHQGILLYLSQDMVRSEVIQPTWIEIKNLIMIRNKFASDIVFASNNISRPFPPVLKRSDCQRCYQASECMLNHAAIETGTSVSSGVAELFAYVTRGLSQSHYFYFKHWNHLVDLEAAAMSASNQYFWTYIPKRSNLPTTTTTTNTVQAEDEDTEDLNGSRRNVIDKSVNGLYVSFSPESNSSSISNHILCLKKIKNVVSASAADQQKSKPNDNDTKNNFSFSTSLNVGDRVNISIEKNVSSVPSLDIEDLVSTHPFESIEPMLGSGTITSMVGDEILVSLRSLPKRIVQYAGMNNSAAVRFRIDKEDSSVGINTLRTNLMKLLIDPHDPNVFNQSKAKAIQNSRQNASSSPSSSSSSQHRHLKFDFLPPVGNIKIRGISLNII